MDISKTGTPKQIFIHIVIAITGIISSSSAVHEKPNPLPSGWSSHAVCPILRLTRPSPRLLWFCVQPTLITTLNRLQFLLPLLLELWSLLYTGPRSIFAVCAMDFLALTQESGGYLGIVEGIIVANGGVDSKWNILGSSRILWAEYVFGQFSLTWFSADILLRITLLLYEIDRRLRQ
jgi:hypothetical protein